MQKKKEKKKNRAENNLFFYFQRFLKILIQLNFLIHSYTKLKLQFYLKHQKKIFVSYFSAESFRLCDQFYYATLVVDTMNIISKKIKFNQIIATLMNLN